MQTCRHFRFQIPREDADLLLEGDKEVCETCEQVKKTPIVHELTKDSYFGGFCKSPATFVQQSR